MPTKTIYVSNDDLNTFDRAQNLAGENLSAVIVRALSEFVTRKEAQGKGMREYSVQVGSKGLQSEKRFVGRVIAKWKGTDDDHREWLSTVVYKTKKGNIAVAIDHKGPASWNPDDMRDENYWMSVGQGSELVVLKDASEGKGKLPEALVTIIAHAIEHDEAPVEYLDI